MSTPITISILLPTRGRTTALKRSLSSLLETADLPGQIEFCLAFDDDDADSFNWFNQNIAPEIDAAGAVYKCYEFVPMGYIKLNQYVNALAGCAEGRWLMFWNDDAVMMTPGWDSIIADETEFNVLRMPTHNDHPYAIFPIVPREWYTLFGYLSAHQISDAWISQVGYLLDIVKTVPIEVLHDRHDLTGNNRDNTFDSRIMLEGRHWESDDFNFISFRKQRFLDAIKISDYLKSQGRDMTWFDNVRTRKQDPWAKMTSLEHDPNQQLGKQ